MSSINCHQRVVPTSAETPTAPGIASAVDADGVGLRGLSADIRVCTSPARDVVFSQITWEVSSFNSSCSCFADHGWPLSAFGETEA
jgi:hypothetical protein